MKKALDERIEDYLNGQLSDEETRLFEGDLMKEEVATVFRETLMLRTLLSSLPPDEPPPDLIDRIEASLDLTSSSQAKGEKVKKPSFLRQALGGFRWGLQWPGYALSGMNKGPSKLKSAFAGMDTIGYSLGPLINPVRDLGGALKLPKKPLWKIALAKLI